MDSDRALTVEDPKVGATTTTAICTDRNKKIGVPDPENSSPPSETGYNEPPEDPDDSTVKKVEAPDDSISCQEDGASSVQGRYHHLGASCSEPLLNESRKKLIAILVIFFLALRYQQSVLAATVLVFSGVIIGTIYSESVRDTLYNINLYNRSRNYREHDLGLRRGSPEHNLSNHTDNIDATAPELAQISKKLSESITTRFVVELWYNKINYSGNKEFPEFVSFMINEAILSFCERILCMKMAPVLSLVSEKVIKHAREFRAYQVAGENLDEYVEVNPCSDFSKFRSKKDTVEQLRKLSLIMAMELLVPSEQSSILVSSFVHEILATHVLFPLVKFLSDPYFLNKQFLIFLKKQSISRVPGNKAHSSNIKTGKTEINADSGSALEDSTVDENDYLNSNSSSVIKEQISSIPKILEGATSPETDVQNPINQHEELKAFTNADTSISHTGIVLRAFEVQLPDNASRYLDKVRIKIRHSSLTCFTKPQDASDTLRWTEELLLQHSSEKGATKCESPDVKLSLVGITGGENEVVLAEKKVQMHTLISGRGVPVKNEVVCSFNARAPDELKEKSFLILLESSDSAVNITNAGCADEASDLHSAWANPIASDHMPSVHPVSMLTDQVVSTGAGGKEAEVVRGSLNGDDGILLPRSEFLEIFNNPNDALGFAKYAKPSNLSPLVMFCYYLCSKKKQLESCGFSDSAILFSAINTSFKAMCSENMCIIEEDLDEFKNLLHRALETLDCSYIDSIIGLCCKHLMKIASEFRISHKGEDFRDSSQKSINMTSSEESTDTPVAEDQKLFPASADNHYNKDPENYAKFDKLQPYYPYTPTAAAEHSGKDTEISMCIKNIIFLFIRSKDAFLKNEDLKRTILELTEDALRKVDSALSACSNSSNIKILVGVKVDLQCYYQALSNSSNALEVIESALAVGRFYLSNPNFIVRCVSRDDNNPVRHQLPPPQNTALSASSPSEDYFFSIDIFFDTQSSVSIIKPYDDLALLHKYLGELFAEVTRDYLDTFPSKDSLSTQQGPDDAIEKIRDWLCLCLTDPLISRVDYFLQFLCIESDVLRTTQELLIRKYYAGKSGSSGSNSRKLSRKIRQAGSSIIKPSTYFGSYKPLSFGLTKNRQLSYPNNYSSDVSSNNNLPTNDPRSSEKKKCPKRKTLPHKVQKIRGLNGSTKDNGAHNIRSKDASGQNGETQSYDAKMPSNLSSLTTSTLTPSKYSLRSSDLSCTKNNSTSEDIETTVSPEFSDYNCAEVEPIVTECLFAITEELFILSNPEKWIGQMGITVLKPILMRIYGETIASMVGKVYKMLVSPEMLAQLLGKVVKIVDQSSKNPRVDETKDETTLSFMVSKLSPEEVKAEIVNHLSSMSFSGSLGRTSKYIGKSSVSRVLKLLFAMVQNEDINRSLVVSMLDHVLKSSLSV